MTFFGRHIAEAPKGIYKLMLIVAAIIWGLAFVVMKDALEVVPTAILLSIRFMATGLILSLVFFRRVKATLNKDHLVRGAILGVMLFAGFYVQTLGLSFTSPGKNAFLTAIYVVFVPLIYWLVARKRPSIFNFIAAVICIAGMGLVSLQDSLAIEFGDLLTIISAFLFAIHIVYVARWSEGRDVLALTVYQFLAAGICAMVYGSIFEVWPPVDVLLSPSFLINMGYLVIFASCICLVFQNLALTKVSPAQVSLLLSLEAVFGVIFSVLLYGESLTLKLIGGFVLIFAAILISELFPMKKRKKKREKVQVASSIELSEPAYQGSDSLNY